MEQTSLTARQESARSSQIGRERKPLRGKPASVVAVLCMACSALAWGVKPALAAEEETKPEAAEPVERAEPAEGASTESYLHFCLGLGLMRARENQQALEEFKKVTDLDPDAAKAWFHLGSLYRQLGKHKESAASYTKAIELQPDDYRSRFELGRVHFLLGNEDEGLKQWEKAAETAGTAAGFIYQRIATYHQRKNDTDKALEALDKAVKASDEPEELADSLADLQKKAGKWDDAAETYRFILKRQPDANRLRLKIAACCEKQKKWKDALDEYDAFFAEDPPGIENYVVVIQAADIARKAGLTEKADGYLRKSIEVIDGAQAAGGVDPRAASRIAGLLARAGEAEKAIEVLKKSLEKVEGANAIELHVALADVFLLECRPDDAEAEILAAMALNTNNADLRGKLGAFYIDTLRLQEAADSFQRAVQLSSGPKRMTYRAALADVCTMQKQYDKAEAQLEAILKDDEGNARIWAALGKTRKDAGRFQQAIDAFQKALAGGQQNPVVESSWRVILAEAYAGLKQPDNEAKQYEEIGKLAKDAESAMQIGYLLYEMQHYEQAAKLIEANVDQAGANKAAARSVLSRVYVKLGKPDRAEETLNALIKENPDEPGTCREMAHFLIGQKRYDDARKTLEKAAALDKDDEQRLMSRLAEASMLDDMGKVKEAEEKYRKLLDEYPDKPITNNNYSYFCAVHDRELDAAAKMVKKALRVEPDTGAYLDTLGWVLFKKGDYKAAVLKLHQAYQKQPDAVVAEHLGDALLKAGQKELAIEKWKRALELDPAAKGLAKKIEDATGANAAAE